MRERFMDTLRILESLGFTVPTPVYLIGATLFGLVGYLAYRQGKKSSDKTIKWIGIGLMFYPCAISETWLMYAVGATLCIGLYFRLFAF